MEPLLDHDLNKRILNVFRYKAAYYTGWEAGIGYSITMKATQQTDIPSIFDIEVRPQIELEQFMMKLQDNDYIIQSRSPFYDSAPFRIGCMDGATNVFQALLRYQEQLADASYTPDHSLRSFSQRIVNEQCVIGGKAKGLLDAIKLNADVTSIGQEVEWRKKFLKKFLLSPEQINTYKMFNSDRVETIIAEVESNRLFTSGRVEALIESLDLITQVNQGKAMPELDMPQTYNDFDQ